MTIEIKPGRYFAAFVHFEFDLGGRQGNFHGAVYRDEGAPEWHLIYRFRYYNDDILDHTSSDEKNWYAFALTPPADEPHDVCEARAVEGLEQLAKTIHGTGLGSEATIIRPRSSDPQVVMEAIARAPWAQVQSMPVINPKSQPRGQG